MRRLMGLFHYSRRNPIKVLIIAGFLAICLMQLFNKDRKPEQETVTTMRSLQRVIYGQTHTTEPLLDRTSFSSTHLNVTSLHHKKGHFRKKATDDILQMGRPKYLEEYKNPCWYQEMDFGLTLKCLPYFFIAGMPKCGTTDLWYSLGGHPQISISQDKERHWWTSRRFFKEESLVDYASHFDYSAALFKRNITMKNGKVYHNMITGDGTPRTLWYNKNWYKIPQNKDSKLEPKVTNAHLIRHLLPDAKIIVILRNPVTRLYSEYKFFNHETKKSPEDFHKACELAISAWQSCVKEHSRRFCVYNTIPNQNLRNLKIRLHANMYVVYIKDWLEVFPRKQMHFIKLEDYAGNKDRVLKDLFKFLDVEPAAHLEFEQPLPQRSHYDNERPMLNKTRHLLEEFSRPYNEELSQLLQDTRFSY